MKQFGYLTLILLVFGLVNLSAQTLTGAHSDNKLSCQDCHLVEKPEKAANQKACIECHGDMTDSDVITFKDTNNAEYKVSPHNSHAGKLRCTLCHASHKTSVLYCNNSDCHHSFIIKVP